MRVIASVEQLEQTDASEEVALSLTLAEMRLISNSLMETRQEIDPAEFQTRLGAGVESSRQLQQAFLEVIRLA